MTTHKRIRQSVSIDKKQFPKSSSTFIETMLTSTGNISQPIDNQLNILNHILSDQSVNLEHQKSDFGQEEFLLKSKILNNNYKIMSKGKAENKRIDSNINQIITDETRSNNEDNWVLF